jgi:hypothetical protein
MDEPVARRTQEVTALGTLLGPAREAAGLTRADHAAATRIPERTLARLVAGDPCDDVGPVFVRGFVRAVARRLRIAEAEALGCLESARNAARPAEVPVPVGEAAQTIEGPGAGGGGPAGARFGVALFVVMLIVLVSLTLSLLVRRGPSVDRGVSRCPAAATARRIG